MVHAEKLEEYKVYSQRIDLRTAIDSEGTWEPYSEANISLLGSNQLR